MSSHTVSSLVFLILTVAKMSFHETDLIWPPFRHDEEINMTLKSFFAVFVTHVINVNKHLWLILSCLSFLVWPFLTLSFKSFITCLFRFTGSHLKTTGDNKIFYGFCNFIFEPVQKLIRVV